MLSESFREAVDALTDRRPFRPFVVELTSGEEYEIDHTKALAWGGQTAAFVSPAGAPRIFDSDSVLQIIDAPAHSLRKEE